MTLAILSKKFDFGFSYELFQTQPYYSYGNDRTSIIYLIAGLLIPVILKSIYEQLKTKFKKAPK